MSQFHSLKVAAIHRETPSSVSITLEIPNGNGETFNYLPGQYITLKHMQNGEEHRRSYSLSSSPDVDQDFTVAVKEVEGGVVSTYLNRHLKEGDELTVMAPEGRFVVRTDANRSVNYGLFAAGSGITPVISILKSVLQQEPNATVTLFYGNRNQEEVIYADTLKAQKEQYGDRLKLVYVFSQPQGDADGWRAQNGGESGPMSLLTGRVDEDKAAALLRHYPINGQSEYYLCGPQGMMRGASGALSNAGIAPEHINTEYFTVAQPESEEGENLSQVARGDGQATVMIHLEGEDHTVQVEGEDTILEAALEAGIDAPYSCRGSVCSTCMAKILEGEVEMDMNYVLTDGEVKEGLILTCQSHPLTARVKITYDV